MDLVVKFLVYLKILFIFRKDIRHLWQIKMVMFFHSCLKHRVSFILNNLDFLKTMKISDYRQFSFFETSKLWTIIFILSKDGVPKGPVESLHRL